MTNIAAILTEDLAINQSDTSPVSISLGSGSVITPTIAKFTTSGSLNKGGYKAITQSPQSYSSGALLERFSVQCATKTTAQIANVGINQYLNQGATGARLIARNVQLKDNQPWSLTGSGWKVTDGDYLVVATASGAAAANGGDCVLKAMWSELYTTSH